MAIEKTSSQNPFAEGAAFIEGQYVPIAEARIPVTDWGFSRSDVTYDVVSVWGGRFFRLDDHLDRFERSVAGFRMTLPHTREGTREILHECVRLAGLREAYVEVGLTRGVPPPGVRDPRQMQNRFFAYAIPYVWIANDEQREQGLNLIISTVQRIPPASVDPRFKNFHWGDLIRGMFEAFERGGDTPVLVDGAGNVTEGPGFNIFVLKDGVMHTPATGVLEGITRRSVIELCEEVGLPLRQALVPIALVRQADEVLLSSTAGGILPVTRIDGEPLGDGRVGPMTTRLHDLYWHKREQGWHGTPVRYD
jgi:branched-chain amino acid aminotransferase